MGIPSVKTIMGLKKSDRKTPITKDEVKRIRIAMENRKGLKVANEILGGFGIETIGLPDGCFDRCQTPDVSIYYVNMGDTYDTTLMRVNGVYRVGNWGDIVERYQNRHG